MTTDNVGETLELEAARRVLEDEHGEVWDTRQLKQVYTVEGFCFGICAVERKSDGVRGTLDFSHSPRFYFSFVPNR